jgi:hypothetical protein
MFTTDGGAIGPVALLRPGKGTRPGEQDRHARGGSRGQRRTAGRVELGEDARDAVDAAGEVVGGGVRADRHHDDQREDRAGRYQRDTAPAAFPPGRAAGRRVPFERRTG